MSTGWFDGRAYGASVASSSSFGTCPSANVNYSFKLYPAEHAFMRDEGARYDPEATDAALAETVALFRRALTLSRG